MAIDWQEHRKEVHNLGQVQEFLKQIVYGGNDGIVTTFAIVAGFAGAQTSGTAQIGAIAVLVFGLANLFADAVSMGLGEFLSTRSQRDLYSRQRRFVYHELEAHPNQEYEELLQMMDERGLGKESARIVADELMKSPELVADLMMNYELEMHDMRQVSPAMDGLVTFLSFVLFGSIPLAPYFIMDPSAIVFVLSVLATFGALVGLGLLRWWSTKENILRCVGETVMIGGVCALVAYAVGAIVG
ncbi:Predicted Fe2+/Mn2+ transporter, VIT1/CCC1 family [Cohaesibacter sp. ES.047]|uniref:VIT1/CCC1 transporter family protein n=1 Tax=Cohaesibacter sp. ES.047 TaxID=1798205 RepID=UPI000BB6F4ED|nr:VIT1/CCC1 transporter family protein [Cohaesibacter sp. ES.047]SNY90021.1 Predicted Fe2+/Mn2+ transporter, VIT1/CCC1 family [Cohaesibacter sp. ES.047]